MPEHIKPSDLPRRFDNLLKGLNRVQTHCSDKGKWNFEQNWIDVRLKSTLLVPTLNQNNPFKGKRFERSVFRAYCPDFDNIGSGVDHG